jgi:hypothetical protein
MLASLCVSDARAAAETQLAISNAQLSLDQGVYTLDARATIELPGGARRAIEAGLTLHFKYEVVISQVRRYLPDDDVATLVQSYELVFHALSERYLVRNLNTGEQRDFPTLQLAIDELAELRNLPLLDAALLDPEATHDARLRVVLDMGNAPEALRWLLFWTDDWSATSEWFRWTVR